MTYTPGSVDIELMWNETRADQTGQSCSLIYDLTSLTAYPYLTASGIL